MCVCLRAMAAANFHADFNWDDCSNSHHNPRNGDILITITCSSVVEIHFWKEATDRPLLSTYRGAWVLSISDMRIAYFGGAEVGNPEIIWPLGFRVLFAYQYQWDLDVWTLCNGTPKLVPLPMQPGLGCLSERKPSCHNIYLVFHTENMRLSPIFWRWNGGKRQ